MKILKKLFFFFIIFVIIYALCAVTNGADRDLWHRLAVGQIFWQKGTVLFHDIFAYTPVKDLWVDHEWGTGVIFYSLAHTFGDYGLIFLRIFMYFAVIVFIYAANQLITGRKDHFDIEFYIVSVLAVLSGFQNTLRSQVFTYLFFALWIYLLERVKRNQTGTLRQQLSCIWLFPVTMLLWANLHGGFVAGFGLLAIYAVGEYLNNKNSSIYLKIIAVSLPVTLINPYGIKFWEYMFTAITMPRPYITEWEPLNLFGAISDYFGFKLILIITVFSWSYKIIQEKFRLKINWTGLILLIVTSYMALKHQRHAVFFAIAASVFSYEYYSEVINSICTGFRKRLLNIFSVKLYNLLYFGVASTAFLGLLLLVMYVNMINPLYIMVGDNMYPTGAVEFIKINGLKGNLLVPFNWGSYALWKLYPQCRVSIDGRYEETYTDVVYEDITDFLFKNKGWQKILMKYPSNIILMPVKSDIYPELKNLKSWKMIYRDKYAAIFVQKSATSKRWKMPDINKDYSKDKLSVVGLNY